MLINEVKDAKARKALTTLCTEYRELCEQEGVIKSAKESLKADIDTHASRAKIDEVDGEGWRLKLITKVNEKLKPEKLLELGVSMSVIRDATEVSTSEYYSVMKIK